VVSGVDLQDLPDTLPLEVVARFAGLAPSVCWDHLRKVPGAQRLIQQRRRISVDALRESEPGVYRRLFEAYCSGIDLLNSKP
jgi:hypothetical protein